MMLLVDALLAAAAADPTLLQEDAEWLGAPSITPSDVSSGLA